VCAWAACESLVLGRAFGLCVVDWVWDRGSVEALIRGSGGRKLGGGNVYVGERADGGTKSKGTAEG
jgi:hypothetical protein